MKKIFKKYLFNLIIIVYSIPALSSYEDPDRSNSLKRPTTPVEKLESDAQKSAIKKRKTEGAEEDDSDESPLVITDLQDEILIRIFSFLDPYDFFTLNIISKQWNILSKGPELVRFRPTKESRIATRNLAYIYKDAYFNFEEWEKETRNIIKNMVSSINKTPQLSSLNIALAQLSIIYEEGDKVEKIDFMLPHFFMSRWPDERERTKIEEVFFKAKQQYLADSPYSHFHVGYGKNFSWRGYYPEFKNHLRSIIPLSLEEKSRLIPRRINQRIRQINNSTAKDFALYYFHSEQAVIIYLKDRINFYLPKILYNINKEAKISQVLLNMVSYYDMCERCGDTFFREYENRRGFMNAFNNALSSKGYTIPAQGINFFVACAGLEKYSSDDGTILRDSLEAPKCSIPHEGKEAINLLNTNLAVAQHYIN